MNLWAGSVNMRSIFTRLFDSNTARLQLRGEKVKLSGNNYKSYKKISLRQLILSVGGCH